MSINSLLNLFLYDKSTLILMLIVFVIPCFYVYLIY